jgi:hypothetical protein
MTAEACREWRESLGAYVLGHLPEDERAAIRGHIEGCAACRAEAESLAPLAGLMAKADPGRLAAPPAPPPALADRIATRISGERRGRMRRRRLVFGFSAATAAATAAVVIAIVISSSGEGPTAQRVAFRSLPPGVDVAATLHPRSFGTEIQMQVSGIRSGTLCRVFMQRSDGMRVPAGSFRYRYSGGDAEQAVLTSALDQSEVEAIGLHAGPRTFVAPLGSGVAGEATSLTKPTTQEDET